MRVLGIDTSCDETAAAVVARDGDGAPAIVSNVVRGQIDLHQAFGGVVPEIAARAHLSLLDRAILQALAEAECSVGDLDGIAVTGGPGLIGGLIVGLMTAKGMAAATDKPLIVVNHLEGHALTPRLTDDLAYPYLLLLVSGGHSQILTVAGLGRYHRLATTIDDALGEAFDKTAKLLGLGLPGGPNVERAAVRGDETRFDFPRPLSGQPSLNMSFSGLKTAVRAAAGELKEPNEQDIADICASFQAAVGDVIVDRCGRAMEIFMQTAGPIEKGTADRPALVAAGGVAANGVIRRRLDELCRDKDWRLVAPPPQLCTDNGAMIAWAGLERLERGERSPMDCAPRSRWPLDEASPTLVGFGKRGAKA